MFHKAVNLKFRKGTMLEVRFQTGEIKEFDMSSMFAKYPQLRSLENRALFTSGKLVGFYGIKWNDDLDIEVETIYKEGTLVNFNFLPNCSVAAEAVRLARSKSNYTQKELAELTGISQADISRIERGTANPSVSTLERIARALRKQLKISFV